jgi:hypothetical protein
MTLILNKISAFVYFVCVCLCVCVCARVGGGGLVLVDTFHIQPPLQQFRRFMMCNGVMMNEA